MTKKVYYLSTCDTCKRIIKELGIGEDFEYQDIKKEKITEAQIEEMKVLSGSYESLFSKVARKYKELNLKEKSLREDDYKQYILDEYTFLKRPVFIIGDHIFVGNSKKNVEAVKAHISGDQK
ncbi:arsenate reductase [Fulvivirga sp. 29W222]|uniref:Arsenate reductase n=1 Tax=Fulvivirga marina TaxID=2494733 RepID=A0A937G0C0_9BACT|nr:ArsC/Spx/MgsR family protein [Fulvivirga marina]MBL6448182.1 arsenate reductase [Fulvivirga marina]